MTETKTFLYLIAAVIVAFLLTYFLYRKKMTGKAYFLMAGLRFLTILTILILLIAPEIKSKTYYPEKPTLSVLMDNSASIKELGYDSIASEVYNRIRNDKDLNEKFLVSTYAFDEDLRASDSISFKGKQTNIAASLSALEKVTKNSSGAILLLSDGNQTFGTDYQYFTDRLKQAVYPVVMGDSTTYNDLKISSLNINKYAYLKNKYPIEVFLSYEGTTSVSSNFKIMDGNQTVFSQKVSFDANNRSEVIQTELLADRVGVRRLEAVVEPLSEEKNTDNNKKLTAIEVIDQKNNIAIVSDVLHPDIGALKKIIESNQFRKATIINVSDFKVVKDEFQLYILYQPNVAFKNILEQIKDRKLNYWLISGEDTNWRFLNAMELGFNHDISPGEEDVLADFNTGFSPFQVKDINFEEFPPLLSNMGGVDFLSAHQVLLFKKIGSVVTPQPLLATFGNNNQKAAVLLGEGIWKWRAASYLENNSTEEFDGFFGKLLQFLASNKKRERLTVSNESFYYGNGNVKITASYYDKNYEFDPNASLEISVEDKVEGSSVTFPMLFKGNSYEVDLSSLPAANYNFTVRETSEKITKTGSFTILDYNVEQQFVNPDTDRLLKLAENTGGEMFYSNDFENVKKLLINDSRYQTIQKSKENIVPLIDWKWLLIFLSITLAAEWFLRKYYGLI
ncbi:VWA domain-containing protein [Galbibacter sp. BG1]|uniref:VWA domain-containing protein n=1 Tax=Galbibacter sp. BG1 TaxID=1170699 RepID=UPI0015B8A28F|nr:VWA domain-containing protein [Galbibacter sp. BG1]QLE02764.1 VWA domain-containing protein [Galbibacter sp. BG1]